MIRAPEGRERSALGPSTRSPPILTVHHLRSVRSAAVLAATVMLVVASCGGDDDAGDTLPDMSNPPATTTTAPSIPDTTAPAPTAPPTTVPPTEPSPTTIAPTVPPTTVPVAPSDMLADWPAPPASPQLADLPYLLPAEPIPGAATAVRDEQVSEPIADAGLDYLEIWRADGSAVRVDVTTLIDQAPGDLSALGPEPVDVDGWDEAYVLSSPTGDLSLQLVSASGYVSIDTSGVTEDDLVAIGRSLRPLDQAGWAIDGQALGLERLHGDWVSSTTGSASREIDWYDDEQLLAELAISTDPQLFRIGDVPEVEYRLVDVGGTTALVTAWAGHEAAPTWVVWSPEPGVVVSFSSALSADDTVAIAQSITVADAAAWMAAANTQPRDGCHSFVC